MTAFAIEPKAGQQVRESRINDDHQGFGLSSWLDRKRTGEGQECVCNRSASVKGSAVNCEAEVLGYTGVEMPSVDL